MMTSVLKSIPLLMLWSQIQMPPCDGKVLAESSRLDKAAQFFFKLIGVVMNGSQALRMTLFQNWATAGWPQGGGS